MAKLKCFNPESQLDLMIMTDSGIIIKLPLDQVSTLKRATQGVRLINLKDNQKVTTVALVEKENESEENNEVVSEEIKVDAEITVDDKLENSEQE